MSKFENLFSLRNITFWHGISDIVDLRVAKVGSGVSFVSGDYKFKTWAQLGVIWQQQILGAKGQIEEGEGDIVEGGEPDHFGLVNVHNNSDAVGDQKLCNTGCFFSLVSP